MHMTQSPAYADHFTYKSPLSAPNADQGRSRQLSYRKGKLIRAECLRLKSPAPSVPSPPSRLACPRYSKASPKTSWISSRPQTRPEEPLSAHFPLTPLSSVSFHRLSSDHTASKGPDRHFSCLLVLSNGEKKMCDFDVQCLRLILGVIQRFQIARCC